MSNKKESRDVTDWIEGPFTPFKTATVPQAPPNQSSRSPDPIFGRKNQSPTPVEKLEPFNPHGDTSNLNDWW
jgi:hypothetical protein